MPRSTSRCIPSSACAEDEKRAFLRDRQGAVVGRKLADTLRLQGRRHAAAARHDLPRRLGASRCAAIYDGAEAHTDTLADVLPLGLSERDDEAAVAAARRPGRRVRGADRRPGDARREIAQAIDAQFRNSLAETLTETEKAFQLGFVAMTEAIVVGDPHRLVRGRSFIILAVMANTMAMTARERLSEYATLKALGFGPGYVAALVLGESLAIAAVGRRARHRLHLPGGGVVRQADGHAVPGASR